MFIFVKIDKIKIDKRLSLLGILVKDFLWLTVTTLFLMFLSTLRREIVKKRYLGEERTQSLASFVKTFSMSLWEL